MTLRVGIVGVGWGTIVHVPAFAAVDGFEVVALCSRSPDRLDAAARKVGVSDVSLDWQSFVRREDLDLISVATPVTLHSAVTLAALEAGKHVLVEKPLGLTTAQCREMVVAADRAGVATATCFELRWTPERATVRSLVDKGVVGQPFFVRLSQSGSYWHPSRPNQELWMYDESQGGGYLNGLVSHDIDFVCSLFGRPVQVCAEVRTSVPLRTLPDGRDLDVTADDTSALLMRLEGGALAVLSASVVGVHSSGAHFEAFGREGTIQGALGSRAAAEAVWAGTVSDPSLLSVPVDDRMPISGRPLPERGAKTAIRAMALMLEDWLSVIRGETPRFPVPSLRDGLMVQAVIEAAIHSARGAGWVDLDVAAWS